MSTVAQVVLVTGWRPGFAYQSGGVSANVIFV